MVKFWLMLSLYGVRSTSRFCLSMLYRQTTYTYSSTACAQIEMRTVQYMYRYSSACRNTSGKSMLLRRCRHSLGRRRDLLVCIVWPYDGRMLLPRYFHVALLISIGVVTLLTVFHVGCSICYLFSATTLCTSTRVIELRVRLSRLQSSHY